MGHVQFVLCRLYSERGYVRGDLTIESKLSELNKKEILEVEVMAFPSVFQARESPVLSLLVAHQIA